MQHQKHTGPDRRKHRRMPMALPVRIRGRETNGAAWEEVASSLDVCLGGIAMRVAHPLRAGQVLHISTPLPSGLRQYDLIDSSYRAYVLVLNVHPSESGSRVGVAFLGRHPPRVTGLLPRDQ